MPAHLELPGPVLPCPYPMLPCWHHAPVPYTTLDRRKQPRAQSIPRNEGELGCEALRGPG